MNWSDSTRVERKTVNILFKCIGGISSQFFWFPWLSSEMRIIFIHAICMGSIFGLMSLPIKPRHKHRQTEQSKYWIRSGQPRSHIVFPNPGPPPLKLLLFTFVSSSDYSLIPLFPHPTLFYKYQEQVFQGFVVFASAARKQHDDDSSSFSCQVWAGLTSVSPRWC